MDIHLRLRKCFQNHFSQIAVDLHGGLGISLPGTSRLYLERQVLIGVHLIHIRYDVFFEFLKPLVFHTHYRTDSYDAEHPLQVLHRVLIVVIALAVHIDSGLGLVHVKLAVHVLKGKPYLPDKRIFKQIPVLSLNSNLSVL